MSQLPHKTQINNSNESVTNDKKISRYKQKTQELKSIKLGTYDLYTNNLFWLVITCI